jgi:cytoskeletal protein RodZ
MASFGETLRRERELRGISLREIADTTKISLRFLQALEADRIDVLPGGLFRKTFVRQYSKHVGLDPERMVAEFLYAHGDGPEAAPAAEGRKGRALPQGAFTALAVLALLFWLAYPRGSHREEEASSSTPAAPSSPVREYVYPPAAPAPAVTEAAVAAPRSSRDELTLTLTAEQDCWVQVDVDGESVLNRVLTAGESETIAGSGEIVLSVGNAGGVRFRVNDRPGVPLGRAGEVKKNIVITRQSLPSLVSPDPPSDPPPSG